MAGALSWAFNCSHVIRLFCSTNALIMMSVLLTRKMDMFVTNSVRKMFIVSPLNSTGFRNGMEGSGKIVFSLSIYHC